MSFWTDLKAYYKSRPVTRFFLLTWLAVVVVMALEPVLMTLVGNGGWLLYLGVVFLIYFPLSSMAKRLDKQVTAKADNLDEEKNGG